MKIGETVKVNTNTAPTKSGKHLLTTKIKKLLTNGNFLTEDSEPYFGYNLFNIKDLV